VVDVVRRKGGNKRTGIRKEKEVRVDKMKGRGGRELKK